MAACKRMTLERVRAARSLVGGTVRRFAVDAGAYFLTMLVPAVTNLLSTLVFTRWLVPEVYGAYSLINSLVAPATVLAAEWAAQPIGRFYSEFQVQNRMVTYRAVVGRVLAVSVSAAAAMAAVLAIYGLPAWGMSAVVAAALWLPFEAASAVVVPILPASMDVAAHRRYTAGRAVLRLVFCVVLVWTISPSVEPLLWGTALSALVMFVPLWREVNAHMEPASHGPVVGRQQRDGGPIRQELKRFAAYGLPMMGWFFGAQLLGVGDRYVISVFLGADAVGVYSASYQILTGIGGLLSAPVIFAAFPIVMRLSAEGRSSDVRSGIGEMTGWYLFLGCGVTGALALLAPLLFSIVLGPAFYGGWIITGPVMAGLVLWNVSMLAHKSLELGERTHQMMLAVLGAAVFNLGANLVAVPLLGYVGAAYTTLLSYGLYFFLVCWMARRTPIGCPMPWQGMAVMVAASALAYALAIRIGGMGFVHIMVRLVLFATIYVLLCFAYLNRNRRHTGGFSWGALEAG